MVTLELGRAVPLTITCIELMLGTSETGMVTLKNAVVPVDPVAVKAIAVPLKDVLVTVASLLTEQELVPQVVLVVVVRMNVTVAEWDRELLVPVTVTV